MGVRDPGRGSRKEGGRARKKARAISDRVWRPNRGRSLVSSLAPRFFILQGKGKMKAPPLLRSEFHWKTQLCKLNCVQSWWKDFGKGIMPSRLTVPNPYMNLYIAMSGAQNTEQRYKSEKAATWCMCGKWQGRRLRVVSTNIGRRP